MNGDLMLAQLAGSFKNSQSSRQSSASAVPAAQMLLGMVVAQDGPIHVVDVIGDGGRATARIPGIICAGGPPRGVGSQVLLAYVGRSPVPMIVGGSGGTGMDANIVSGDPITVVSMNVFGV